MQYPTTAIGPLFTAADERSASSTCAVSRMTIVFVSEAIIPLKRSRSSPPAATTLGSKGANAPCR
jgi:hypothetical protein